MPSLAAVVLLGVSKMTDFGLLATLWRLQKASWAAANGVGGGKSPPDFFLWVIPFGVSVFWNATEGE